MLPRTCHHSSILTRIEARKNNYINGSKYIAVGEGTIQLSNSTAICTSITKNHYPINRQLMRTLKHAYPMHDDFITLIEDAP